LCLFNLFSYLNTCICSQSDPFTLRASHREVAWFKKKNITACTWLGWTWPRLATACCLDMALAAWLGAAALAGRMLPAVAGWPWPWLAGRDHGWLERAVAAMYS
jgi:hypothetical protein